LQRLAKPTAAEPAHLSIVVLPFTNLSGDLSQDYFADGITENLTTDLSRIRNSFVIARNTAFTFKGKNVDAKEISKELGVRYVLEGSVQRDQNHVRVNAQLIDGESGAHLWAVRFEEGVADLFKLQDQVVARLANALGYELVRAEATKGAHSTNPDAIDLAMRGWALVWQAYQQSMKDKHDSYNAARSIFEHALKLDPNNVDALVGAALAEWSVSIVFGMDEKSGQITRIEELLANAIRIDPTNAPAYIVRGRVYINARRTKEAVEAAQIAVRLNPLPPRKTVELDQVSDSCGPSL
jgi:TolB-like protein